MFKAGQMYGRARDDAGQGIVCTRRSNCRQGPKSRGRHPSRGIAVLMCHFYANADHTNCPGIYPGINAIKLSLEMLQNVVNIGPLEAGR